jgi:hypothetical protein
LLASTRLGDEGAALSAVSQIIRGRSDRIGEVVGGLSRDVDGAAQCLGQVAFRLSVAKLQAQMSAIFVTELLDGRCDDRREGHELRLRQEDLGLLSSCLKDALELLFDALADLDRRLEAIAPAAGLLRRDLDVINVLEVNGRIEAAHVREATGIVQLFGEIREQTETARSELSHLATAAQTAGAATSGSAATAVHEELGRIRDNALQLAA